MRVDCVAFTIRSVPGCGLSRAGHNIHRPKLSYLYSRDLIVHGATERHLTCIAYLFMHCCLQFYSLGLHPVLSKLQPFSTYTPILGLPREKIRQRRQRLPHQTKGNPKDTISNHPAIDPLHPLQRRRNGDHGQLHYHAQKRHSKNIMRRHPNQ